MSLHEFELRRRAYKWFNHKFSIGRDEETILQLVRISDKWVLSKKLQETTPEEIHDMTIETYTDFKKDFIKQNKEKKIWVWTISEYLERLEYELKVIKEMWYNTYFLVVADFVRRSKKNMIVVGPWRWSWAWSILAWFVRITDVDPLQFGLLFERFLNPARVSMPDFDIDFEDTLREKVIEYVTWKYWKDKVCSIWTYMKMATKAAFKDVARVLWLPFEKSNQVSNLIPEKVSLSDALKWEWNDELKSIYDSDEKIQKAIEFGWKLEGNLRQLGVHACGIIISPEEVTKFTPIQYIKDNPELGTLSQYDWPTLEYIGLLKMDFLWLRNLSVIKNCIKIISAKCKKEWKEIPEMFQEFNKDTSFHPPLDDQNTYEKIFQTGNTTWIFQFESQWMRRFLIQLKANCIDDLVAMNALYRPWPMEFIPSYINRKHWKEEVIYMLPELRQTLMKNYDEKVVLEEERKLTEDLGPIMNPTYWIAVYQEQLIFLVQAMAGFSLAEADMLRRWIWKKKLEVIEALKIEFAKRWQEYKNYKPETTKFIYEKMIEPAAFYSFNKSHSVCYSYIAYQTAYLKSYFPVEFYAALIRSVEEDTDQLSIYIDEAKIQWITVLVPDVNVSFNHVAAIGNEVRLGFVCTKWVGFEIWKFIENERETNWKFVSLEDFLKRCKTVVNKKSTESLIKAWCFDSFEDRKTLLMNNSQILEWAKESGSNQWWLFSFGWEQKLEFQKRFEVTGMEKLFMEQEVFKCFVSWHPLDWLYPYIKKYSFISQFKNTEDFWAFIIIWYIKQIRRAKKKWFFVQFEDISWSVDFFLKDMLDFKEFDILIIHWYKAKSVSVEKIIKSDRKSLIKLAWSRFDPEVTVFKAKIMRWTTDYTDLKNDSTNILNNIEKSKNIEENIDSDLSDVPAEDDESTPLSPSNQLPQNFEFTLPESMTKIQEIIKITKEYKWEIKVKIGTKEFELNDKGVEKLRKVLN